MTPTLSCTGRRSKSKSYLGNLQLSADTDEQGFKRQLWREIQLLHGPPRLPNGLGSVFCAHQAFSRCILPEFRQLVQVDCGALGADRDGHQVAVPGSELLELCEQLLPLRATRGPLDALLRLARRQLEAGDVRL